MRKALGNGLLVLGSVLLSLASAEVLTRYVDGLPLLALPLPETIGADTTGAHLDDVPRAAGVARDWFFNDPPPLPNRIRPPEAWARLDRLIGWPPGDTFRSSDMFKAWNSALVGDPCAHRIFSRAPGQLFVYDPSDGRPAPPYHYLPNATTPVGLVTNQFGWRGPPARFARTEKLVRIVFVGASTTVDSHAFPFSYPEFVGHWLDLWAAVHRPDIRFEVLNAGRESVTSTDIAAIVREEVAPLRPDLVVYYEGANQFRPSSIVKNLPAEAAARPLEAATDGGLARWLRNLSRYLELARRAQAATGLIEFPAGGKEWPKPDYKVIWPEGLDEQDPDLAYPHLPVTLNDILHDLDQIRTDLAAVDGELAMTSYMWLVKDGMVVNPIRHRHILEHLNVANFPFRYRDLARLAAFQNRVYRKYASIHGLPFFDVAGGMPFDPDLFIDAIHTTYPGTRLRAWVVLQQLVPIIEKRLMSGAWPKPVPVMGDSHPAFTIRPRQITFNCKP